MAEQLCANYTPIMDRQGRNALKGAIAFEGYADCESFHMLCTLHACNQHNMCLVAGSQISGVLLIFYYFLPACNHESNVKISRRF